MKFIKSLFGLKDKKKVKYEANTLAEANGTPDIRTASTEKTVEQATISKPETAKKTAKKPEANGTVTTVAVPAVPTENKKVVTEVEKKTAAPKNPSAEKPAKKEETVTNSAPKSTSAKAVADAKPTQKKVESSAENTAKNNTVKSESAPKATSAKASTKPTTAATSNAKTEKKDVATDAPEAKKTVATKPSAATNASAPKSDSATASTEEITVSKSARTGKFEIKKSKDGRFVFNLYASNNVIVATSQIYSSSTSAMNGIKSVIANAPTAPIEDQSLKNVTTVPFPKWEIYLDKGEQYRFRLCASNGSCVCHSQGYTSKANCKKGIESIIKFAGDAEITKAYLEKKDK